MTRTMIELDQRASNGITVTLLWSPVTNEVAVHVRDEGAGESFELECAPDAALTVFHHPYAYAASRSGCTRQNLAVES